MGLGRFRAWLFGTAEKTSDPPPKELCLQHSREIAEGIIAEGYPAHLIGRAPTYQRSPGRKGKRYSEEERVAEAEFHQAVTLPFRMQQGQANFDLTKSRALYVASPGYVWRTSNDSGVCQDCASRSDSSLPWQANIQPPGTFLCSNGEVCRCYLQIIVPD